MCVCVCVCVCVSVVALVQTTARLPVDSSRAPLALEMNRSPSWLGSAERAIISRPRPLALEMRRSQSSRMLYDSQGERLSQEATDAAVEEALAAELGFQMEQHDRATEARAAAAFRCRQQAEQADGRSGSDRSRSPRPATARSERLSQPQPEPTDTTPMEATEARDTPPMEETEAATEATDWSQQGAARNSMWLETQPTTADIHSWIAAGLRHIDLRQCPECFLPEGTVVRIRSHRHGWHQIVAGSDGWSWVSRTSAVPAVAPMARYH